MLLEDCAVTDRVEGLGKVKSIGLYYNEGVSVE